MYLSYHLKDGYYGEAPKDENGQVIEPAGYNNDEDSVFSVTAMGGTPV